MVPKPKEAYRGKVMKRNVLIIGAGGVAQVVAHKCAQHNDILGNIHIASRTVEKCQQIVDSVREKGSLKTAGELQAHALDALDIEATKALIAETQSQLVINVGSPFINMSVLQRSEEHTSELQSRPHLVCRLLLEKKKKTKKHIYYRLYIYILLFTLSNTL